MFALSTSEPIDYLLIGHIACDITPDGLRLGGTAAYSALTAHALGLRVGIVTAWGEEIKPEPLQGIPVVNFPAEHSTTFENVYTSQGRVQTIRHIAPRLDYYMVPLPWRSAQLVHLGPIAQEVAPSLVQHFPAALLGLTPQGWLRQWDAQGHVSPGEWPEGSVILRQAGAAVISVEDVEGDDTRIEEMASSCPILAVTEAANGVSLYWHGDVRRFRAPAMAEVDATGAGDIFAAAFFTRLYLTRDPWEAARFATQLASFSVTRVGLASIPTTEEIEACQIEVL
ncbi:MAG: PfkB family carbohydrate kinase [Chloroflexota bacterium]